MGIHFQHALTTAPLIRPRLLIEAAQTGARLYQRARDLPGAFAGSYPPSVSASPGVIAGRLAEIEGACEELRRNLSPAYRPGRHVQVLSALLAEAAIAAQAKASGSDALRSAI